MSLIERTVGAAKNARDTVSRAVRDPQVMREGARDLPLRAFQLAVRGFGQALVVTDRLRGRGRTRPGEPRTTDTEGQDTSSTGGAAGRDTTVRVIHPEPAAEEPAAPSTAAKAAGNTAPESKQAEKPKQAPQTKPAQQTEPVEKAAPADGDGPAKELPVPDYDSRSVPSLRARLRGLSAADIKRLVEYEQTHADRAEVVAMYERRIAKLAAEG